MVTSSSCGEDETTTVRLLTGYSMPRVGMGTTRLVEAEIRANIEAGARHLDCARVYGNEAAVGRAIARSGVARRELFLTTKVFCADLRPARLRASVAASLADLRTAYVDLLLIHWPVKWAPGTVLTRDGAVGDFRDAWRAMEALVAEGKARSLGVSNFDAAHSVETKMFRIRSTWSNSNGFGERDRSQTSGDLRRRDEHSVSKNEPKRPHFERARRVSRFVSPRTDPGLVGRPRERPRVVEQHVVRAADDDVGRAVAVEVARRGGRVDRLRRLVARLVVPDAQRAVGRGDGLEARLVLGPEVPRPVDRGHELADEDVQIAVAVEVDDRRRTQRADRRVEDRGGSDLCPGNPDFVEARISVGF